MKKVLMAFCLCLFSSLACSQSGEDSVCQSNLENIFKVHAFKIRYEAVLSLYTTLDIKDSIIRSKNNALSVKSNWNQYFKLITGSPMNDFEESYSVKRISEEEMNQYFKQLNCTPEKALKEYRDFVQNIKSEKELYLECVDAEFAKGDLSKYAKDIDSINDIANIIFPYNFLPSWFSVFPPPMYITKLDYLKIFKEFIINDNEETLPAGLRVIAYLKCNCKIP